MENLKKNKITLILREKVYDLGVSNSFDWHRHLIFQRTAIRCEINIIDFLFFHREFSQFFIESFLLISYNVCYVVAGLVLKGQKETSNLIGGLLISQELVVEQRSPSQCHLKGQDFPS